MKFKGELHNIKLINFSVDIEEVANLVPEHLEIFKENGKAIISMVDVQLKKMRPALLPFFRFNYRHVAFRLLLNDAKWNQLVEPKGIYFLKSFSENSILNFFGNLIAKYKLDKAQISEQDDAFCLQQRGKYIHYALDPFGAPPETPALYKYIKRIDRAYDIAAGDVEVTKITRKKWPIQPVKCYHFATNYFKTAKLLGAFKVEDVIHYTWNKPVTLKLYD